MEENKVFPTFEITDSFRDGLFIILDEITEDLYRIGGGEHPEVGIETEWLEAPWGYLARSLGEKYGDYSLYEASKCVGNVQNQVIKWMSSCSSNELISSIALYLNSITKHMEANKQHYRLNVVAIKHDAANRINNLFKTHKLGYEVIDGKVIKLDSYFLHNSVVKETISLLKKSDFEGPLEEFQRAINAYNEGNYKEVLRETSNSLESTLKSILNLSGIELKSNATANSLVKTFIESKLLPAELETFSNSLNQILSSGLPALANRRARHGQGKEIISIPESIASFALHLAGSYIVFLIKIYDESK